ncbi:MAG: hypothetical protein JST67_02605 [Bacteroidetes bacterium]|nr:hypothetical protein [Bacteroidota bacterium]
MAVYKFRIFFEEDEEVTRDIEIKSSQTFLDFFHIILESIGFDTKQAGSFFVSDEQWRKHDEITLLEEDLEAGVKLMKNAKIATCIEQPNQRFLLLYDKQVQWSFLIELIKLVPEDAKATYPRCIKKMGTAPKQYKQKMFDKLREEVERKEKEGDTDDELLDEQAYRALSNKEDLLFDEQEEHDLKEDENNIVNKEDDDFEDDEDHEEYEDDEYREDGDY